MTEKIPNHILVAFSSWVGRIITAFIQLYLIKTLISILGVNEYAVFSIITGIMGWFMLFDFGIGSSLQNYISEHRANSKNYNIFLKASFVFIFLITILMIGILYLISPFIAKFIFKNFNFIDITEKRILVFVAGAMFLLTNIINVLYKVWYGEMRGYLSNIFPAFGYIVVFLIFYFFRDYFTDISENKLLYVVVFYFLPIIFIPLLIAFRKLDFSVFQVGIKKIWVEILLKLIKRGIRFWIFAVMAVVVLQVDYIIMGLYLSPDDIVTYNIASRIFIFGFFIYNSVLSALWPVFSEKIARNEIKEVNEMVKKYIFYGILYMFFFTLIFIGLKDRLVSFFTSDERIIISAKFITIFGFYYILRVWCDTYSMLLQSASILKPFIILVPIQAVLSIIFQIIFVKKIGIYGIVLGLMLSFIFTVVFGLYYYSDRYILRRSN